MLTEKKEDAIDDIYHVPKSQHRRQIIISQAPDPLQPSLKVDFTNENLSIPLVGARQVGLDVFFVVTRHYCPPKTI